MAKGRLNLSIDTVLIEKAKTMNLNISEQCEEMLKNVIAIQDNDIDAINLELLNVEITRLQNSVNRDSTTLRSKITLKEQIEKRIKEKEEQDIRKEKENIENAQRCIQCKQIVQPFQKKHIFKAGIVCNSCFMSASGLDHKRWDE